MQFLGEYESLLTDKNRVSIPAAFRAEIPEGDTLFLNTLNIGWLEIYPNLVWDEYVKYLSKLPRFLTDKVEFSRLLFSQVSKINLDAQGRFVLSESMLQNLQMRSTDSLSIIGVGDHVEVWAKSRWSLKKASLRRDINSISDRLSYMLDSKKLKEGDHEE